LVQALLEQGHQVRVLDDFSTGRAENLAGVRERLELVHGSVTDLETVAKAVERAEWVFHLAALPSVPLSLAEPVRVHEVCATGTLNVLVASQQAGVARVVYAGSSSAYGDQPGALRRENDPAAPQSPYAAAKLAGEHYCQCFHHAYGLATVRLRLFNIFGPRQDAGSPYSGVIARFVAAYLRGERPTIFGDGRQTRDFTYVADAVQAFLKAAQSPAAVGGTYNVGSGIATSLLDLVAELNRIFATDVEPIHAPPRPGDVRHSQADISRAQTDLGYRPHFSFAEGLRRTVQAFSQDAPTQDASGQPSQDAARPQ
jgi:UDP-glucose 4-epimerase